MPYSPLLHTSSINTEHDLVYKCLSAWVIFQENVDFSSCKTPRKKPIKKFKNCHQDSSVSKFSESQLNWFSFKTHLLCILYLISHGIYTNRFVYTRTVYTNSCGVISSINCLYCQSQGRSTENFTTVVLKSYSGKIPKIRKNPQNLKDFGHFSLFSTVAKVAKGAAIYPTAT